MLEYRNFATYFPANTYEEVISSKNKEEVSNEDSKYMENNLIEELADIIFLNKKNENIKKN